jgi:hypothetical protein
VIEWTIETSIKRIKSERDRLLKLKSRHEWEEAVKSRWSWMVEWLAKTDEEHLAEGNFRVKCKMCDTCLDEWMECSFSFCDEYGCGMELCKSCAEKIYIKSRELIG